MFSDLLLYRSAPERRSGLLKAAGGRKGAVLSRLAVLILSAAALASPLLLTAGRTPGLIPA